MPPVMCIHEVPNNNCAFQMIQRRLNMAGKRYLELKDVPWDDLKDGSYSVPQLLTEDAARQKGIKPWGAYKNGTQWTYAFQYGLKTIIGKLTRGIWDGKQVFYVNIKVGKNYFDIMLEA